MLTVLASMYLPVSYASQEIEIGVIEAEGGWAEQSVIEWAEEDINKYMRDNDLDYSFTFHMKDAESSVETHLDRIKEYDSMGINLIIGGPWSSMAKHSLEYITVNDILLTSSSSTSAELSLEDNLYRLAPPDNYQAKAIIKMLKDWGIKAIIVFEQEDIWGTALYNSLTIECQKNDIDIINLYQFEPGETSFSESIASAIEDIQTYTNIYGADNIGVQVLAFSGETISLLWEARNHPTIYDIQWFGTESIASNNDIKDQAFVEAINVGLYSTFPTTPLNYEKYDTLNDLFKREYGYAMSLYMANLYDAAWIYALSVVEVGSTEVSSIRDVINEVAMNYEGVSGYCTLDENGDRTISNYDIWGYRKLGSKNVNEKIGFYSSEGDKITWYITRPEIYDLTCQLDEKGKISEQVDIKITSNPLQIGKQVTLEITTPSNNVEDQLVSLSDGTYTYSLLLEEEGEYQVKAVGEKHLNTKSAISKVASILVVKKPSEITLTSNVEELKVGEEVELTGTLNITGSQKIELKTTGSINQETEIETDNSGAFSYALILDEPGNVNIVATWEGNSTHQKTTSNEVLLKINPLTTELELQVVDDENNPLENADIQIKNKEEPQDTHSAKTDSNGIAVFEEITLGKYEITCTKNGFKEYTQDITLESTEIKEEMIQLQTIPETTIEDEPQQNGGGIPGFPLISVMIGILVIYLSNRLFSSK